MPWCWTVYTNAALMAREVEAHDRKRLEQQLTASLLAGLRAEFGDKFADKPTAGTMAGNTNPSSWLRMDQRVRLNRRAGGTQAQADHVCRSAPSSTRKRPADAWPV